MDQQALLRLLEETERFAGLATWIWDTSVPSSFAWSAGMRRLLGLPDEVGSTQDAFLDRVHPDDRARVAQAWLASAVVDPVPEERFRVVRPDGSVRFIRANGSVLPRASPSAPRVLVGTLIDVTTEVLLQERLQNAEKSRAVAGLAAGVAHDLGNWLTVLRHVADQLGELHPVRLEMERALAPCFSLTRELLALAQERPSEMRIVDVRERLVAVAPVLRTVLGPGVDLQVVCHESAWVKIDPTHLEGVLLNLAVNARDAMAEGGRLVLTATVAEHEVVVEVADDGHGISPDRLPRLFEPYFTTKPVGRGTGLGLASVRGTVRQHGGEVGVRSELGSGTTFEIRLPRRRAPRVLVVDDLVEVREVVCEVLRHAGMGVVEAAEGEEALERLDEVSVDLVLTDLVMPGMDGETLVARLLERGGPPVVVVTGYGSDRVKRKVPVVRKPFRPAEVLDAVSRALAGHREP